MNSITKEAYLQLNEKVGIEVKYTNYPDDEMVVLESMKQTRGELLELLLVDLLLMIIYIK
jgi:hypothetical protein